MRLDWLPEVLEAAGLKVEVHDGWETRGKEFKSFEGIVAHHTGAGSESGLIALVRDGRKGDNPLPGPLSQVFLSKDGTWHILASGTSNHAGKGNWQGITDGNGRMMGVEAHNAGTGGDPWEPAQMESYIRGCAAILKHAKLDSSRVCGHKEYRLPKGYKVDPTFDMFTFRTSVEDVMNDPSHPPIHLQTTAPMKDMLRKGDMGESVKQLQQALNKAGAKIKADGNFGPKTDAAVRAFQKKHRLTVDGKVGPKTWAALGVK